ncbi:hypothetical protein TELCIR_08963 [Teladorsagia circumcincta]|uniref:Uncharacterized protein n=1 Tax=Teladorsagia circumcincta TaxID=45464 RepID=A0A2G9UG61_TELCI|nr:hypothetical protein TELCIR_08963 [Teladorsagia circumcincta]
MGLKQSRPAAVPVDHYTQNETAFFDRKHKAGDALSFNRNQEEFKPPTLIPAKELVAKLAEKARHMRRGEEEADKHPDDRENNDRYVNEMPNADEKDYKEHGG